MLPADELASLPPQASPARRQAFVLGRLAARLALRSLLGAEGLEGIHILPGVFGQPVVQAREGLATRLGVSLSHRHGLAAAVAFEREHPMGIDIERVDPADAETLHHQELPDELAALLGAQASETAGPASRFSPLERATLLWSCKEALGKAMGCGLTVPPEFLAVASAGQGPALEGPDGLAPGWRGTYRHSVQFAWQAWRVGPAWLSLALPARSEWQAKPALHGWDSGHSR